MYVMLGITNTKIPTMRSTERTSAQKNRHWMQTSRWSTGSNQLNIDTFVHQMGYVSVSHLVNKRCNIYLI